MKILLNNKYLKSIGNYIEITVNSNILFNSNLSINSYVNTRNYLMKLSGNLLTYCIWRPDKYHLNSIDRGKHDIESCVLNATFLRTLPQNKLCIFIFFFLSYFSCYWIKLLILNRIQLFAFFLSPIVMFFVWLFPNL